MTQSHTIADEASWRLVPRMALGRYNRLHEKASEVAATIADLPREGFVDLHYKTSCDEGLDNVFAVRFDKASSEVQRDWFAALAPLGRVTYAIDTDPREWTKFAFRTGQRSLQLEKAAVSSTIRAFTQGSGLSPSPWSDKIPGVPGALAGTLGGGLIGAGLGYGAGWLGSHLLPETWDRGKLRRTLAVLGGIAGATPGAILVGDNLQHGRPLNSSAVMGDRYEPIVENEIKGSSDGFKAATSFTGFDADLPRIEEIPVDQFAQLMWQDPTLSQQLPVPLRAAAVGLLESAWYDRDRRGGSDGGARLVGPRDIARITAGMGTGYVSGAIVGKALGALMGMPEDTQDKLKQIGIWSGVLSNVIPLAFGAR